jgi:hypothetical protein
MIGKEEKKMEGRPSQNSWNFFLYKTQPHCVGLVRKVVLLSVSLGLKTVVLANPSDQKTGRPGQNLQNFFFYKTHTCFVEKMSIQILRFLTNFEVKLVTFYVSSQQNLMLFCYKLSHNFKSLITSPFA